MRPTKAHDDEKGEEKRDEFSRPSDEVDRVFAYHEAQAKLREARADDDVRGRFEPSHDEFS